MLTIFTPTYNRGYIIEKLFQSLIAQSCHDFEWVVIDDGSEDNTSEFFDNLNNQNLPFRLLYRKKENGGKHTAANLALELSSGEYFFVVDSDDYLANNAVERIYFYFNQIENEPNFCGICGLKAYFNGNIIGTKPDYDILDTTILDYRFKQKYKGDRADVFYTKLLKMHRFPENDGEKWCPLSIVWNRFGKLDYKVRYFNEVIYFAEYLADGISLNRNKIRRNSPQNTRQYYKELTHYPIPFIERIKAGINFWRFGLYSNENILKSAKEIKILIIILSVIPGIILHLLDKNTNILDPRKNILKKQVN